MVTMALPQKELRYWLANEDWYPSQFTQNWLKRTPTAEAAETLDHIAQDAQPQPPGFLSRLALIFANTGFATSSGIAGGSVHARQAGVRAALMLANMNDLRAIVPLVRVFDPYSYWQSKYQREIEIALTHLLLQAAEQGEIHEVVTYPEDVRQLVTRILQDSRKRSDLSGPLADLLIAACHYLQAMDSAQNRTFLEETAAALTSRPGNRARAKAAITELIGRKNRE